MVCDKMICEKVDRLEEIKLVQKVLKQEQDNLEADLLKCGQADLHDTKLKTVTYDGKSGKATVTMAESLKLIYPTLLESALGAAYKDAVTVETKYKISAPATRMLTGLWTDSYTRLTVAEVIDQLPADDGTKKLLRKKLRGANYAGDKQNLVAIGGFDEKAAGDYAYFIAEAAVWESFQRLMKATGNDTEAQIVAALDLIGSAVIVEETPKITIETSERPE